MALFSPGISSKNNLLASHPEPIHSINSAHYHKDKHTGQAIRSMVVHPNGHLLVTGGDDRVARFWTRSHPGDKTELNFELIKNNGAIESCKENYN